MPKDIRIKPNALFFHKKANKRELQQITLYYLYDTEFKDFIKLCKVYTKKPSLFLLKNAIFSDNV